MTNLEKQLFEALDAASEHLNYCGYGDSWERQGAIECGLPDRIEAALDAYRAENPEPKQGDQAPFIRKVCACETPVLPMLPSGAPGRWVCTTCGHSIKKRTDGHDLMMKAKIKEREASGMSKLVKAAVRRGAIIIVGKRHCDCIRSVVEIHHWAPPITQAEQGFMDEHGFFWTREQAKEIAFKMGQLTHSLDHSDLLSEDLW